VRAAMERTDLVQHVYAKLAEAHLLARERTRDEGPSKYTRPYSRLVSLINDFIMNYAVAVEQVLCSFELGRTKSRMKYEEVGR